MIAAMSKKRFGLVSAMLKGIGDGKEAGGDARIRHRGSSARRLCRSDGLSREAIGRRRDSVDAAARARYGEIGTSPQRCALFLSNDWPRLVRGFF
jgi:hypothetical protein